MVSANTTGYQANVLGAIGPTSYTINRPRMYNNRYNVQNFQPQPQPPPASTVPICNLNDSVLIVPSKTVANTFIGAADKISFRKLPFYKQNHEVLKPSVLSPNSHCTLPPRLKQPNSQEFHLSFVLSAAMATDIARNRKFSNGNYEFGVQAQIRICAIDTNNTSGPLPEYDDFLPLGLNVRLNDKICALPIFGPNARAGVESRRVPRPVNITPHIRISPININNLIINWSPEVGKTFIVTINLVEKLTAEYLLNTLRQKPTISVDVTKLMIKKQYKRVIDDDDDETNADDDDVAATIVRVSLVCPLAKFRMMYPAKGKNCSHLQCFDGSAYITLNEKKPMWMCPVCNKALYFDDLLIDQYFNDVLENKELSADYQEVQLFVDGTWKGYDEDNNASDDEHKQSNKETPTDNAVQSDVTEKQETAAEISMDITEEKPSAENGVVSNDNATNNDAVVDLTSDDEEEMQSTSKTDTNQTAAQPMETNNSEETRKGES